MIALLAFAIVTAPTSARALASPNRVAAETYFVELPGPQQNETRRVYVWRPPSAARGALPVLYVADGQSGLETVIAGLRPAILDGRARPILVVAVEASHRRRGAEYVFGQRGNHDWQRHFDWFVGTVMAWAEANAGASTETAQRGVGGYSNGADWALAAAALRPDLFSKVLAHSPVNAPPVVIPDSMRGRWVISAGWRDAYDDVLMINNRLAGRLGDRAVRQCTGPWGHRNVGWREISPGSVAWLFELADPAVVETETERAYCRFSNVG